MINIQDIIQGHMDAGLCREYAILEARKELDERRKIMKGNSAARAREESANESERWRAQGLS